MSYILDALKKLEGEKNVREPGVLVVGSVPWGEGRRSRRPLALAAAALGIDALVYMPLTTPLVKQRAVIKHGGDRVDVILSGDSYDEACSAALARAVGVSHQHTHALVCWPA